jgi:hypothetical protein
MGESKSILEKPHGGTACAAGERGTGGGGSRGRYGRSTARDKAEEEENGGAEEF